MSDLANSPAYPVSYNNGLNATPSKGITLRQHYAGLAMQGLIAADTAGIGYGDAGNYAVKYADSLIAALESKP